jgi:MFS family permease
MGYVWIGSTSALIHRVLPVRTRALGIGFMLFFSNITALAFGPLVVGIISDYLKPTYGAESIRYALAGGAVMLLVSCALYLRAAKYIQGDIAANDAGDH